MAMYPAPTPASIPSKPPKGRGALIALIALVLLCGLAGGALAILTLTNKPQAESTAEASDSPARVAAIPIDSDVAPEPLLEPLVVDEPTEVTVSIVTDPPGAEVFRGGESIGMTPVNTRFDRSDKNEKWQLFLDGYEVEELEVSLDVDFHSELILKKLAASAPPVQRPSTPTASNNGGSSGDSSTSNNSGGSGNTKKPGDKKPGDKKPGDKGTKTDTGPRTVIKNTGVAVPD